MYGTRIGHLANIDLASAWEENPEVIDTTQALTA